ncbi:shikimate kinase [Arenibacter sp. GZD96]|uniref:shikimate kinase n=1 Tax=Aurantibrevibacter litoralis TaxID=3106030 RepID=UPI002AFE8DC9|nr:shikimate kinase [Arenibacter sp. GZD-96]MEA1785435.1 shikimate kinase [Arenibacter sp. GZD-96]
MKIVLVGYMGSGKSAIGNAVAKRTGMRFLDLDDAIENSLGIKIPDIFQSKGELFFRKHERQVLAEILSRNDNFIVSTGGGTPCYSGNMDYILQHADHVVYLQVPIPALVRRLSMEKEHRPLIKHIPDEELPEFIGKHLFERNLFYSKATHTIACQQKSIDTIAQEIAEILL